MALNILVVVSHLYKPAGENVSIEAHNDISLCFLICCDKVYEIITILLEELSC